MSVHEMLCDVIVKIAINDHDGVVDRYVEGREVHPYGCHTEDQILRHLAYNATANGATSACDLDGWADLEYDAATMTVEVWEVKRYG